LSRAFWWCPICHYTDICPARKANQLPGIVVEIVGTEIANQSPSCEEHINCGELLEEDIVVGLQGKVHVLVWRGEETVLNGGFITILGGQMMVSGTHS